MDAISLYSGAGGMDVGFHAAGFRVRQACESDRDAAATFARNFPATSMHVMTVERFVREAMPTARCDVVFGGPPCQGYSVGGRMSREDPRSVEVFRFMDAVDRAGPEAFVMENVDALANLDRFRGVLDGIRAHALSIGYATHPVVLDAYDFGVPQRRRRLFLFGSRTLDEGAVAARVTASLAVARRRGGTVRDVLGSLGPADTLFNPLTCRAKVTYAKEPVMRRSPYAGLLFNGAGRPLALDAPAPTIAASTGGNKTHFFDEAEMFRGKPSLVEAYHASLAKGRKPRSGTAPPRLRRMTLAEAAAFQTFHPHFAFVGAKSSRYRQIGNAVPCVMAQAVANAVMAVADASRRIAA